MLTSSPSPNVSASSSPNNAFHPRSCRASYRSSSSSHISQRSHASSRRIDGVPTSANAHSSSSISGSSSQFSAAPIQTVDAGTQYTPSGFPPTYKPPRTSSEFDSASTSSLSPHNFRARSNKRRETSPYDEVATAEGSQEPGKQQTAQSRKKQRDVVRLEDQSSSSETGRLQSGDSGAAPERTMENPPAAEQPAGVVVLPAKYEECNARELGVLISDMLMELVRLNDNIPLVDGQLTRFHSRAPPGITVQDYLRRLIIHATLSPPILLSMVYYVDRLCALYPAFTISSLTVHRFLITAATVASKGLSDSFWTNSVYARVGGLSTRELALLEVEFLRRLEWRIVPRAETLVDYYRGLIERNDGYMMASDVPMTDEPTNDPTGADADSAPPEPADPTS